MIVETQKRESGIPSNRGSRHGEFVNKLVHTARTLRKWDGMKIVVILHRSFIFFVNEVGVRIIPVDSFFRTEVKS